MTFNAIFMNFLNYLFMGLFSFCLILAFKAFKRP